MQAHFKNKKNFLFSLIILILVLANPLYSSENNTQTKFVSENTINPTNDTYVNWKWLYQIKKLNILKIIIV